jgi:hypothetical protein
MVMRLHSLSQIVRAGIYMTVLTIGQVVLSLLVGPPGLVLHIATIPRQTGLSIANSVPIRF